MKVNKGLMLSLVAGCVAPAVAVDDTADRPIIDGRTLTHIPFVQRAMSTTSGGFSGRVVRPLAVYDTGVPVTGVTATGVFAGPGNGAFIYDDIVTIPAVGAITLDAAKFGMWYPANGADQVYLKFEFFTTHVGTGAAATSNPWSGAPSLTNVWDLGTGWAATSAAGAYFPTFLDFTDNGGTDMTLPAAGTYGVRMSFWGDAAATTTPLTNFNLFSRANMTCWPVGSSDFKRWFGAPADAGNPALIVNDAAHSTGTAAGTRAMFLGFRSNVDATAPASQNLGTLPDGLTTNSSSSPASGVKWYQFALAGDATDTAGAAGQFLDIDTEGSAGDVTIAVYDAAGDLIAFDSSSGSGTQAQLSFGMGRRLEVTGGKQYDGRNFDDVTPGNADDIKGLSAAAGPYNLAVSGNGAAFSDGWVVTTCGNAAANFTVNFRTNTNGAALAASALPLIEGPNDDLDAVLGQITSANPGTLAALALEGGQVRWIKFTTCKPADATNTVTIACARETGIIGGGHALFDGATGNLVASASNADGTLIPSLAFGGANPGLAAGTYYLAQFGQDAVNAIDFHPSASTNGRFHVRSRNGDNGFDALGSVTVSWADCNVVAGCWGPPCVADFDDGSGTGVPDGGVTIDDLIYYLGLFEAGDVCADVDDGSGTNTLDGGVTIDDLIYYLGRFEAGC